MKFFKSIVLAGALSLASLSAFGQGLQGPTAGANNPTGGGFQAYIPAAYGNVGSHFLPVGTAPTITAGCSGAGSAVDGNSTDSAGQIIGSTSAATTCTLTFANAFTNQPYCITSGSQSAILTQTVSTTTLVVTFASTANFKFWYSCFGK